MKKECAICKKECEYSTSRYSERFYCSDCGEYVYWADFHTEIEESLRHKLHCFVFYHKTVLSKGYFIGRVEPDTALQGKFITFDEVENWYPKTFEEKINLILLKMYDMAAFEGDYINTKEVICQLMFCKENKSDGISVGCEKDVQIQYIIDFLTSQNYISDLGNFTFQLLPRGLERIERLNITNSANKDVFVAMSFHKSADNIRAAIKTGIINAGFSPLLIDEIVHNHQIIPEMLRLIKASRFMIMDITNPNFGAYYEAGFAQGLGKEVIVTCRKEVWENKDFLCKLDKDCFYKEAAIKPHFDIVQKQILIWNDFDDLAVKLTQWVKYIIG